MSDIVSQFIDSNGKTRIINVKYKNNKISIFVYPKHPFTVPIEDKIYTSTYDIVKKFVQDSDLEIKSQFTSTRKSEEQFLGTQKGDENKTSGLWITRNDEMYGYIPIKEINTIKSLATTTEKLEIITRQTKSELSKFIKCKKIIHILERYVIYTFSHRDKVEFEIIPNHVYDIEKLENRLFFKNNNIIFSGKKIIVLSAKMQEKLEYYLEACKLHYPNWIRQYKYKNYIDDIYETVDDFIQYPDSSIFLNVESLVSWYNNTVTDIGNTISNKILEDNINPYFYNNNGSIVMIQNAPTKQVATAILESWYEKKINPGFYAPPSENQDVIKIVSPGFKYKKGMHPVFEYPNNHYGAVLIL